MSFSEAIQTCLRKYADFTGRARRSEYWWFYLFFAVVTYGLLLVVPVLYFVAVLGLLLPVIAAGIRRLHDTGRSGWFLLLPLANIVFLATEGDRGSNQYGEAPA